MRTRAEALARYREKRARRTHAKKIRYHLRKVNADKRPRIKGRFVKKGELAEMEAAAAAAAADDAARYTAGIWGDGSAGAAGIDAAAVAGGVMGCWEQQDDFLQALQLPGVAVEMLAGGGGDAAAAAAAAAPMPEPVPAASVTAAAAAPGRGNSMQLFGSAVLPGSGAAEAANGEAAAAADAAAAAMDMHLLGHLDLGFGALDDVAAAPLLGEDFFADVHDMTESSGASQGCLLLN
jgi:hypothetical protein